MRIACSALLVLGLGCGGGASSSTSPPAASSPPAGAPEAAAAPPAPGETSTPPFSAEQIRGAMPVGTRITFRMEGSGEKPFVQEMTVTAADAEGCTIHDRKLEEDGKLLADEGAKTTRWTELESHGRFPAALTTRTDSSVEVPAGRFDTWYYVVQPAKAGEPEMRMHFSRTIAGPPISMEVVRGDAVLMKMVMLSRTPR
jgi:hypothetical protein